MAYSAQSDIVAELPEKKVIQLTDDERLASEEDDLAAAIVSNGAIETRIESAISKADNLINSFIYGRYDVEMDPVKGIIKDISVSLAIVNLHLRRGSEYDLPETIKERQKMAMESLKALRSGHMNAVDGTSEAPASSLVVVSAIDTEPEYTRDTMGDF